jgi:hypothetical protein
MPWFRTLLLGIAMLLLGACGGAPASVPSPSPSPTAIPSPIVTAALGSGYAPWQLNLDFSGDLTAHVTGTAAPDNLIPDECTGDSSARTGKWASTMAVNIGPQRYALVVIVTDYKGAAAFTTNLSVEVHSADQAKVWQNAPDDPVSFTVGADQKSGLLDVTLSNAAVTANKLMISGHWSCQP